MPGGDGEKQHIIRNKNAESDQSFIPLKQNLIVSWHVPRSAPQQEEQIIEMTSSKERAEMAYALLSHGHMAH